MTPSPDIIKAEALPGYRVRVTFDDGITGTINLSPDIESGRMNARLKDPDYFAQVFADVEIGTIRWPEGEDACPSVIYDELLEQRRTLHAADRVAESTD